MAKKSNKRGSNKSAQGKKSTKDTQNSNLSVIIGVMVAVLALAGAGFFIFGGGASDPTITRIQPQEYTAQFASPGGDHLLIDVRTPSEFDSGHIAGAVNIPLDQLENRLAEIPQSQDVVIYCRSGNRSAQAANILASEGYSSIYDLGGTIQWTRAGYALQ